MVEFPHYFDSSMLEAFKACPRKGYYSYLRHLTSSGKGIDLVAGGAFAAGLEDTRLAYYSPTSEVRGNLPEALQKGQARALTEYGDVDPGGSPKTPERVVEALEHYFNVWNPKVDTIQPYYLGSGEPAVEISFALPIGVLHPVTGEEMLYVGRYDMLGTFENNIFVVDEKTTKQLGQKWRNQWDLRAQFTGYCWAAQEFGYPVVGTVIRGISFLKTKFGTEEAITYRTPHMIKDWLASTRHYLEQIKTFWATEIYPQQLGGACTEYSGCQYKMLCQRKDPERWIPDNYSVNKWDPLERNKIPEEKTNAKKH